MSSHFYIPRSGRLLFECPTQYQNFKNLPGTSFWSVSSNWRRNSLCHGKNDGPQWADYNKFKNK